MPQMKKHLLNLSHPHKFFGKSVYSDLMLWLSSYPKFKGHLEPELYSVFLLVWLWSHFYGEPFPKNSKNFIRKEIVNTLLKAETDLLRFLSQLYLKEMEKRSISPSFSALSFSMYVGICWQTRLDNFKLICW